MLRKARHQLDPILQKALKKEQDRFESTHIPIVTVSASYKEDVKGFYGYQEDETLPDIVFSRAHYSMALGTAIAAWGEKVKPKNAYIIDPTNFVKQQDWAKIVLTEMIGKTLARKPMLKKLKDYLDSFARQKLPILSSIESPLIQLTSKIKKPILSFHIAAGNILAKQNRTVIQVITDPHVREEYLTHAHLDTFFYCVFDEATKTEALEKAAFLQKKIDPNRIIVTGPPVDPRIVKARKHKTAWRSGTLKLCLTTGGLGTNTYEIRTVLKQILPLLRKRNAAVPIELLVYASTHKDIAKMVTTIAREERISLEKITDRTVSHSKNKSKSKLRLIYHPQIVDANELLVKYGFGWADGFITKPSGDMAYDAAAAGCFLLTLQEWGEWEYNIRQKFEGLSISRKCYTQNLALQLEALTTTSNKSQSWIEQAMNAALNLDNTYISGAEKIVKTHQKIIQNIPPKK